MIDFDLTGPLPRGTTLLEASAGTGKTYAIAALATRYVAEGHATIDQLLMVTFGRAATRELRERVREALTRARDVMSGALPVPSDDAVLASLMATPAAARGQAAARLARAVADFDSATIATTHQFCRHALAGLGIAADTDPGETLVEDITGMVAEVVEDLYLRKYATAGQPPPGGPDLTLADARAIAAEVMKDPQTVVHQPPGPMSGPDGTRVRFAQAVRAEVLRRRRGQRLLTFDDLVLRLEAALADELTGEQACQRLRAAYRVVLVDEFQDTDPAQWHILSLAFHGRRTLVLIGDPKQAIYAFRGADVFSYLDAASHAHTRATLPTNYRSDAAVVAGLAQLMGGLELGDPRIVVRPVGAHRPGSRITGVDTGARVRLRVVQGDPDVPPKVSEVRPIVAADVAADVVALLSGPARIEGREDGAASGSASVGSEVPPGPRPIRPGDIAVLVPRNQHAELIHEALSRVGVPSVVSGPTSVFATPAADEWRTLLRAIENPRRGLIRAAARGIFLGYTGDELALHGDAVDDELGSQLRSWSSVLASEGVAGLLTILATQTGVMERVLAQPDGERQLTDLRHVASCLHAHQRASRCGVTGLLDWLDDQAAQAGTDRPEQASERTRRLETDADAVQILTVHRSKGLEFGVVYVPFGWDRHDREPALVRCHADGRWVLDVRTPRAPGRRELLAAHNEQADGESLRLLYVALTRAASLVVAHWAPGRNAQRAPLTRMLAARARGLTTPPPRTSGAHPEVDALVGCADIAVEQVPGAPSAQRWTHAPAPTPDLAAASWTRQVDTQWRRTSYTGLTAGVHGPERTPLGFRDDEPDDPAEAPSGGTASAGSTAKDVASAFAELPAGAEFGTLVHGILEAVDTSAPDLAAEVSARCADALSSHPLPDLDSPDPLARALLAALRTPLGPLAAGLDLASIAPRDRLAELEFEVPMGGADPDSPATLTALAALLRRHLPPHDPVAAYPDRLLAAGLGGAQLRGYLTGSIDAVLRVPPTSALPLPLGRHVNVHNATGHRYLVVDYKTNLLRRPGDLDPSVWAYRASALPEAMMASHYPLQALLYSAALHRYLRWRLPGYDPATHLGGVLYLFLRGMAGPETPTEGGVACGIFAWQPPAELVVALSDLLDGRAP